MQRLGQDIVHAWLESKGRPSLPIDTSFEPRQADDFAWRRKRLPLSFFEPFNRILSVIDLPEIVVQPNKEEILKWNRLGFGREIVQSVIEKLDGSSSPRIIPFLVEAFSNLEWERRPARNDWENLAAIVVPGSRTYDRAAEAFRAYWLSNGNARIICSGNAPYYDPDNTGFSLTEAEANVYYLRMLGVSLKKILSERESMDTEENAAFLQSALASLAEPSAHGKCKVLLVTSPFHLARFRLNVECLFEGVSDPQFDFYAIGSRASRYWAETYFVSDIKSGFRREDTMGVVFNEYLKIAFDLSARNRRREMKPEAKRDAPDLL